MEDRESRGMKLFRGLFVAIFLTIGVGVAVATSIKLVGSGTVAPNAPGSKPKAFSEVGLVGSSSDEETNFGVTNTLSLCQENNRGCATRPIEGASANPCQYPGDLTSRYCCNFGSKLSATGNSCDVVPICGTNSTSPLKSTPDNSCGDTMVSGSVECQTLAIPFTKYCCSETNKVYTSQGCMDRCTAGHLCGTNQKVGSVVCGSSTNQVQYCCPGTSAEYLQSEADKGRCVKRNTCQGESYEAKYSGAEECYSASTKTIKYVCPFGTALRNNTCMSNCGDWVTYSTPPKGSTACSTPYGVEYRCALGETNVQGLCSKYPSCRSLGYSSLSKLSYSEMGINSSRCVYEDATIRYYCNDGYTFVKGAVNSVCVKNCDYNITTFVSSVQGSVACFQENNPARNPQVEYYCTGGKVNNGTACVTPTSIATPTPTPTVSAYPSCSNYSTSCSTTPINGSTLCQKSTGGTSWCCASGKTKYGVDCLSQCTGGAYCYSTSKIGASKCLSGTTLRYCCPSGQRDQSGTCRY